VFLWLEVTALTAYLNIHLLRLIQSALAPLKAPTKVQGERFSDGKIDPKRLGAIMLTNPDGI
jgi:hypothetical protein